MRLLVTADLHYTLRQLDWLERMSGDFDAVIVAGDLLDLVSIVELEVQAIVVLKYFKRISQKTRLFVSSGNHDLDEIDDHQEKWAAWLQRARALGVVVDGDTVEFAGWTFSVCPWWDGPVGCERLASWLETSVDRDGKRWCWLHHAPPAGVRVGWDGHQDVGDQALRTWIERLKPDYVFSGHIHSSPFRKGGGWIDRIDSAWVFNPGRQIGPEPTWMELDLDQGEVRWYSQAGNFRQDLSVDAAAPVEF